MAAKILVVDDDKNICELLRLYLQREGFELYFAVDGSSALDLFRQKEPDLILLDLMLPLINGQDVCRLVRQESTVPIILLTARDTTDDKVEGFSIGADDYIVKPFDPLEVVARIKAHLRRSAGDGASLPDDYTLGQLRISAATYEVRLKNQRVSLKPKEFQLLLFLVRHTNIVFTREQLLEKVWGYDFGGETRTIDVHVERLRKKLEAPGEAWSIKTVWGVGYKLEVM